MMHFSGDPEVPFLTCYTLRVSVLPCEQLRFTRQMEQPWNLDS